MVKPTGANDADTKVFINFGKFLTWDDAAGGKLPNSFNHGNLVQYLKITNEDSYCLITRMYFYYYIFKNTILHTRY